MENSISVHCVCIDGWNCADNTLATTARLLCIFSFPNVTSAPFMHWRQSLLCINSEYLYLLYVHIRCFLSDGYLYKKNSMYLIDSTCFPSNNLLMQCTYSVVHRYRKVASSRPVYYSILNSLGQRSQYISIKFPLHKQSDDP